MTAEKEPATEHYSAQSPEYVSFPRFASVTIFAQQLAILLDRFAAFMPGCDVVAFLVIINIAFDKVFLLKFHVVRFSWLFSRCNEHTTVS